MSRRTKILPGGIAFFAGMAGSDIVGDQVKGHLKHKLSRVDSTPVEALTKMESGEKAWINEHARIGFNALTLSYVISLAGVIVLLSGVYQDARRLQNNLPRSS